MAVNLLRISLLLILVTWQEAYGQNAVVFGTVTGSNGKPLEAATVGVPGTSLAATSDQQGKFEFQVPANERLTVVVRHLGYDETSVAVYLNEGEHFEFNPVLAIRALESREFEVTEERFREKPMTKIDVTDVRLNPSTTGSIEALLPSRALGVSVNNELSSQYSVRGGNFDENLIYVNGIMVYRPFLVRSGQQEGLSFVNSDLVEEVSFSSGGFEAKYGDKLSSVLDVRYKKPEKFAGSASLGLLGANLHLENASDNKRFTQLHGFRYFTNQYLVNSSDVSADYRPHFIDYQTYLTYSFNPEWEISFLGNYAQNKYRFAPESRQASFGTISSAVGLRVFFEGQEIDDYQTSFGAFTVSYSPRYNLNLKWITSAFHTRESETFDIQGDYYLSELETDLSKPTFGDEVRVFGTGGWLDHGRNYLDAIVASTEIQGSYVQGKNTWLWGVRYQRDDIYDRLSEWTLIDSVGYSVPYDGQEVNLFETIKSINRIASNRVMGYLQRDWNWELDSHNLYLSTGVRAHYWDLNGQTTVSPRIQAAIKPNWKSDWLFRASWGYYHQPAFYRELRNLFGQLNTNVLAQTSIHYVLGADHNFRIYDRPFKIVTEVYYKSLKNLVAYELDNVRIRYYADNNAQGYATGLDFKINGEFVKGVESWLSISVMKTEEDIIDDVYYIYYNQAGDTIIPGVTADRERVDSTAVFPGYVPRPTDQRVSFALTFQDYLPNNEWLQMHLSLVFGSGLPTGPPSYNRYQDIFRMPPYRRVDIGFSAQLKSDEGNGPLGNAPGVKSIWASLEVFNLLAINNTISYLWIKDNYNREYGVPNYLTGRRLNLKLIVKF
ncbi:MAG: carboxypeptidase-like regulatory domain-containing protein [Salibacteraceae bacterium]